MSFDMPSTRKHGWLTAQSPAPGPGPRARLGRGKRSDDRPMPMPGDTELRTMAHAACADHVRVDGLTKPVCIAKGVDRAAVIAEARELAGAD